MFQLTLLRRNLEGRDVEKEERAWRIDQGMLLLFASLYIIFNVVYWSVCLSGQ